MKHINNLKQDIQEKYTTVEAYEASRSAMHEKLFGNVWKTDTLTLVKSLLFENSRGQETHANSMSDTFGEDDFQTNNAMNNIKGHNTMNKARLRNLARQLHMSVDKLTSEARFFCDDIASELEGSAAFSSSF